MTDKPNRKRQWIILLLVSLGVAAVLGIPLGYVVAIVGTLIREDSLRAWNAWMTWTMCAVPLALGMVTFVMGIPFVIWNAPARTKKKTLATGAIWLGYVVLLLVGYLDVGHTGLWGPTLAIIASVITLLIWRRELRGTQPPQ